MQFGHAALADRIHLPQEACLGGGDLRVGHLGDQPVGFCPRRLFGLADDEVEANAEAELATPGVGAGSGSRNLGRDCGRWLTPGQVGVALLGGEVLTRIGGAAEEQRRMGALHRRVIEATAFHAIVLAGKIDGLA